MVGKKIIFSLLVLIAINAHAQDSTNKKTGIITKKTFGPYRMNGEKLSWKQVTAELYKVPSAIPLYKKAKTSQILGYSFFVPFAVIALANNQNNNRRLYSTYRPRHGLVIMGLLSGGVSIYFLYHSLSLYKKAIRAHNNAVITIY